LRTICAGAGRSRKPDTLVAQSFLEELSINREKVYSYLSAMRGSTRMARRAGK
jgi:hypothetical protein